MLLAPSIKCRHDWRGWAARCSVMRHRRKVVPGQLRRAATSARVFNDTLGGAGVKDGCRPGSCAFVDVSKDRRR